MHMLLYYSKMRPKGCLRPSLTFVTLSRSLFFSFGELFFPGILIFPSFGSFEFRNYCDLLSPIEDAPDLDSVLRTDYKPVDQQFYFIVVIFFDMYRIGLSIFVSYYDFFLTVPCYLIIVTYCIINVYFKFVPIFKLYLSDIKSCFTYRIAAASRCKGPSYSAFQWGVATK